MRISNTLLGLALVSSLAIASRVDCDVAILGGGAAGAGSAVFLKDKGYKVCLFERRNRLGGNCGTYFIPSNELPANCPTCPNWVETGVKYYENSTYLNRAGIGQWNLATDEFVTRFAPNGIARQADFNTFPSDFSGVFDFNLSIGPIFGSSTGFDANFMQAYARLYGVLLTYNWIDQIDGVPTNIPTELLLPFSSFIHNYNLYPLVNPIFGPLIVAQGILDWDNTPTLYALYNMKRSLLELIQPTKSGLRIDGGCKRVYDGIYNYLGADSVFLNAQVTEVKRPNGNSNNGVIKIKASINGGEEREWKVNSLIIAFAPKTSSMTFLDADNAEKALFEKVRTRVYWPSLVEVTGPIEANSFALFNFRINNPPFLTPIAPAVVLYVKDYRYGPTVSFTVYQGETEPTREEAIDFVNSQMDQLPRALFNTASTDTIFRHQYEPYFPNQYLTETPNPFVQFRLRQGIKNTYYVGGLLAAPGSSAGIWEHAYNLINENF